MKKLTAIIIFFQSLTLSFGQGRTIKEMVDSLSYLKADTLNCSADLYWRIIAKGASAIPLLIDRLTDTTQTSVRFHCKKTRLNVGEIAQFALTQIADFPVFLVTEIQFDVIMIGTTGKGCWSFYDFIFINSNKIRYQNDVKNWYDKQWPKYKTVKISEKKQTRCQKQYGIGTFYRWIE